MTSRSPQRPAEAQLIASLAGGGRFWVVGSIHGDAERLAKLHYELADHFQPGDRLIYLGGYMGYGPRVIDTINEILVFRRQIIAVPGVELTDVVYLRGAQEEMWQKLLQLQFAQGPTKVLTWMVEHGAGATIGAYGGSLDEGMEAAEQGVLALTRWTNNLRQAVREWDGHSPLMSALRHAAMTDDGALLFVHAGIDPLRPLDNQVDHFWWGSTVLETMTEPYGEFAAVVRGFCTNGPKIQTTGPLITLDGGCGRVNDGTLVALCLDGSGHLLDSIQA